MSKRHLSPVSDSPMPAQDRGALSPVAVVALSALADAVLLAGARGAGLAWGNSLLVAWAGGAALTVTGLLTAAHISLRNDQRKEQRRTGTVQGTFQARRLLRDSLAKWDADRKLDQAPPAPEPEVKPQRQTNRRA